MLPPGMSCAKAQGHANSRAECSLHCLPRAGAAAPLYERISDFSFRLSGNGASRDYTVLLGRGKPSTAAASLPALGLEGVLCKLPGDTEMGGAANCREISTDQRAGYICERLFSRVKHKKSNISSKL